ncbi:MAG: hypothetical protein IJH07_03400 [Ruminococcus sp.]|nr:hypothetical protein [Ruminococcus sp.]
MKKRIVGVLLALALILSVCCLGVIGASADENTAVITVGDTTFNAKVGDIIEYNVAFTYTGKNLATAQIELPVDFSILSGYTQSEIATHLSKIAPATGDASVVQRFDTPGTTGVTGYVMNFVSAGGFSFQTQKTVLSLLFTVKKAGSCTLAAKVRYADDIADRTVVDSRYTLQDTRFAYAESVIEAALDTPQPVVSTAADGIRIKWEPIPGASLYRLYRQNGAYWSKYADTAETSYLDTNVENGTRYNYTVRCLSSDGQRFISDYNRSGKSAVYYAAPKLRLSNAADGISISWDAVEGAAKYRVYYRGSKGWTKLTDTTSTSALDTDVKSGYTYTYTIRTMDANGNHLSWYYEDGFKIQFIQAPSFSLSNAADGVKISWNAVDGAEKYRVFYYGSRGWTRLADTAETSFIDTDVSSNHNYTYTVRCISADGSAYTGYFRAGKSIKYYAAPILKLSNAEDGVSIQWDAVAGASKYRVYYKGRNGWTKLIDTSSTSAVDTDVASGTNYTYTIRAMDSNGNHLSWYYADGFKIQFIRAPQFSLSNAADGVKISWDEVGGAKKYRVFYYGSKGWTRLTDTADTSFIDTDVSSNHNYRYTVRCITEDGSAYTSYFRAGKSIKYYAAPVLTLSSVGNGVSIKWNAVSGAAQYRIYYKNSSGSWTKLTDTKSTSYVHTAAKSGTAYTYTARAMDADGNHLSWYYADGFTITYQK